MQRAYPSEIPAALLLSDAWFDVVLSWNTSQRWHSLLSAVVPELPLALLLWWLARSLVLRTVRLARAQLGLSGPAPALRRIVLFAVLTRVDVALANGDVDQPRG